MLSRNRFKSTEAKLSVFLQIQTGYSNHDSEIGRHPCINSQVVVDRKVEPSEICLHVLFNKRLPFLRIARSRSASSGQEICNLGETDILTASGIAILGDHDSSNRLYRKNCDNSCCR